MQDAAGHLDVAFPAGEWLAWLGGLNYHRNLLRAIADDPDSRLRPTLVIGEGDDAGKLADFGPVEVVRSRLLDRRSPGWVAGAVARRAFARDPLLERLLVARGVRVVSHSNRPWRTRRLAMLGWIPDFQHRKLPEFFPEAERTQRDRGFARIAGLSTLVIVSSECSRRDLADFDPAAVERARVLRFVAEPPEPASLPGRDELAERYAIGEPYVHVPNQFWAHKNHALVVEALALMRDREGGAPLAVATGETRDHRRLGHFDGLMARAGELRVADRFRPLGVLPYGDVAALMRDSVAVLNPSLSEGWATSVEESKSMGKRVVLSDIDVHREQDPPDGIFFDAGSAEALADALGEVIAAAHTEADRARAEAAAAALPARRLEFARAYEAIVAEAVSRIDSKSRR